MRNFFISPRLLFHAPSPHPPLRRLSKVHPPPTVPGIRPSSPNPHAIPPSSRRRRNPPRLPLLRSGDARCPVGPTAGSPPAPRRSTEPPDPTRCPAEDRAYNRFPAEAPLRP